MKDFKGILVGKLTTKNDDKGQLVIKVESIKRSWNGSKAEDPKQAIGKSLMLQLPEKTRLRENFRGLKVGDAIEVGTFQIEAGLRIVELLRKAE
ncbi:MAG: hypothetical protein O3A00_05585 [Planctomycetota bacterium]|nr:hypothetical protein [Planctomycetota bacterium]